MPGPVPMRIQFPTGGINRRGGYSQEQSPFTSPGAYNARSVGPLEKRGRGGSRPCLTKYVSDDFGTTITAMAAVTYLDANYARQHVLCVIVDGYLKVLSGSTVTTTTANLVDDDGNYIITDDGDYIIFDSTVTTVNPLVDSNSFQVAEKGGKLLIADSTLKEYSPLTGVVQDVSGAPASQPLVCVYQERIVLSGADHMFYVSSAPDKNGFLNWTAGADIDNVGRSVMGYVGDGGRIGEKILSQTPWHDRAIVFGTADSLWAMYGNPTTATKKNVSPYVGVLGSTAIEVTPDGLVIFLARNGLYAWQIGSEKHPQPFSERKIPEELLDVDTSTTDVIMKYDHRGHGVHLFLTPSSGNGDHWWLDLDNRAIWPMKLITNHQPLAVSTINVGGYSNVILGCKDGYLRRFSDSVTTDDGSPMYSHVLLGPFHIGREDGYDGMLREIAAALAEGSGEVYYKVVTGDTAEAAVDSANTQLDAVIADQY